MRKNVGTALDDVGMHNNPMAMRGL